MRKLKIFKTSKMIAVILLLAISVCAFPQTANADVLPMISGDFFWNNSEDCTYHNRDYFVDSTVGEITVYTSPISTTTQGTLQNGEVINVVYTYEADGITWGGLSDGWVIMDNLGLIYDCTQFYQDFSSEFESYDGEIYFIGNVILYTYPNSGDYYQLTEYPEYMAILDGVQDIYTDENGNVWGAIGYYRGWRNGWFCINDPTNTSFNGGVMENLPSVAQINGEDTVANSKSSAIPFAIFALVVVLVSIATVMIIKTKKKQS